MNSASAKKSSDFRDSRGDRPVLNDFDSVVIGNSSFARTDVTEDLCLRNTDERLLSAERSAIGLNSLDDSMDTLEMLPDKTSNPWVLGNHLITLGTNLSFPVWYIKNTLQVNEQCSCDIPIWYITSTFRISRTGFPAVFLVQKMPGTFTVFQVM